MPGAILTATATPQEIVQRIIDILTLLTQTEPTVLAAIDLDGVCKIGDNYVPVLIGVATRGVIDVQRKKGTTSRITRNYEFRVLFAKVCGKSLEDQLEAVSIAQQAMDDIPGWLARYPYLQLNHKAPKGVLDDVGWASDVDGVQLHRWRDSDWAGVTYLMPVTTIF